MLGWVVFCGLLRFSWVLVLVLGGRLRLFWFWVLRVFLLDSVGWFWVLYVFGGSVFGVFVFGLGFGLVACFGWFVMDVLWVVLWVCVCFVTVGISTTMIV